MRGGPNLPDGDVYFLDLELLGRFPFSITSALPTVVAATLNKVFSTSVLLVVEAVGLTNKVPSSLTILAVLFATSVAVAVAVAFLHSSVLRPHLHHVGVAYGAA